MNRMKSLVDEVFEKMAEEAVRNFVGEEAHWSHDKIMDLLLERAKRLLDTDKEIQELLRKKVMAAISDPNYRNKQTR